MAQSEVVKQINLWRRPTDDIVDIMIMPFSHFSASWELHWKGVNWTGSDGWQWRVCRSRCRGV